MGNYLNRKPNGLPLGFEKASDIIAFCDEEISEVPEFDLIPHGLVLICVVDNGAFEAALVADTRHEVDVVKKSIASGDDRPMRFFLVKREWVRQMADKPLASDKEDT